MNFNEFVQDVFKDATQKSLSKILNIETVGNEYSGNDLIDVSSEAIDYLEYNHILKILTVTFNSGSSYQYLPVEESAVDSLINASSIGATFVKEIRNDYIYYKVA
jgi:hypothetical protein